MRNQKLIILKKLLLFLLITCHICSCSRSSDVDLQLAVIENKIRLSPDSALYELENNIDIEKFNKFNKAIYYVLLAQAKSKNNQKIESMDSLIDFSCKELVKNKPLYAKSLLYKGKIWKENQVPQEALVCHQKALDLLNNDSDLNLKAELCGNIGYIFIDQNLFEDAFKSFQTGYNYSKKSNDIGSICIPTRNMGIACLFVDKPDSALMYFKEALQYAESSNDSIEFKDLIYNDISIYYTEIGNQEAALNCMRKITVMTDQHNISKGSIFCSMNDYDSAYYHLDKVKNSDDLEVQIVAYKQLYKIEETRGNFEKALQLQDQFFELYDSLQTITYTSEIHSINREHNITTEVNRVKANHTTKMIIIISISIIIFLAIITIFTIYDRKKKIKQEQAITAHERKILEKEKEVTHLQRKIAETQNIILRQKHELQLSIHSQQEINQLEQHLKKQQEQLNNLRIHLLAEKPIYKKILKLRKNADNENIEILPLNDREELKKILLIIYADFVNDLLTLCPVLTEEDVFFCVLAKLNFPLPFISACAGYPRLESARQRRYRIKKKLTEESSNLDLYESLFCS